MSAMFVVKQRLLRKLSITIHNVYHMLGPVSQRKPLDYKMLVERSGL